MQSTMSHDRFIAWPEGSVHNLLRLTVKQPDSRGIPGFFEAIFSVVTQFEVCPVGCYNCRMELLGRTGGGMDSMPAPRIDSFTDKIT